MSDAPSTDWPVGDGSMAASERLALFIDQILSRRVYEDKRIDGYVAEASIELAEAIMDYAAGKRDIAETMAI